MSPSSIPARPTNGSHCTCVWLDYANEQERRLNEAERIDSRVEVVTDPLSTAARISEKIASVLPGGFSPVDTEESHERFGSDTMGEGTFLSRDRDRTVGAESIAMKSEVARQGDVGERDARIRAEKKRAVAGTKGLASAKKPDVLIRNLKKRVVQSSENKTRVLVSYKEELAVTLHSLLPPFYVREHPRDTRLCHSCMNTLSHNLLHSSARFAPYLSESSTRGYLALIDDAVVSHNSGVEMEVVSHHELRRIMKGELAVVEWRITIKLARLHKKTDFLNLFPVNVGEFAELKVNSEPPVKPEGFLKKTGKSALKAVGLGGSSNKPSPQDPAAVTSGPV